MLGSRITYHANIRRRAVAKAASTLWLGRHRAFLPRAIDACTFLRQQHAVSLIYLKGPYSTTCHASLLTRNCFNSQSEPETPPLSPRAEQRNTCRQPGLDL